MRCPIRRLHLVFAFIVASAPGCDDKSAATQRVLMQQRRQDLEHTERVATQRACTSMLQARRGELAANQAQQATLHNMLTTTDSVLAIARAHPGPAVDVQHDARTRILSDIASSERQHVVLVAQVRQSESECAAPTP